MDPDDSQKVDLEAEPQLPPDRHHNRVLLWIAGGLPTVATLLGFMGSMWWPFDVLANFRVQYAIVLAVAVAVCLAVKRWKLALLFLLPTAMNVATIVPLYVHPEGISTLKRAIPFSEVADGAGNANESLNRDETGKPLRVISMRAAESEESRGHLRTYLKELDADIIIMHGVNEDLVHSLQNQVAPFDLRWINAREDMFGLAVLVRVSMRPKIRIKRDDCQLIELPAGRRRIPAVKVNVKWGERDLTVLGVYVMAPFSPEHANGGQQQTDALISWVNQQKQQPVVVIGNLGCTPWTARFDRFMTRTGLANSQMGFGVQSTWPATGGIPLGEIPIDHCLHAKELVTVDRQLGPTLGADHRPLIVTMQWRDVFEQQVAEEAKAQKEAAAMQSAGSTEAVEK